MQTLSNDFQALKQAQQQQPLDASTRRELLLQLKNAILSQQSLLVEALSHDYGYRSTFDSVLADIMPCVHHLNYTLKHLKGWMHPQKRRAGLSLWPSTLEVHYQTKGVVGIIVPWNFPINLSLNPLVTALAAGNRVMVKLSELTPQTNAALRQLLAPFAQWICVVEGEQAIAAQFSALPFDHLLFTGSTKVGKLVAQAAAKNLTPITLELGGKSPVVILPDADLTHSIDAILLGKCINAGQICVAPDYVLLPQALKADFIARYFERFQHHYPQAMGNHSAVHALSHIINDQHHQRLQHYLDDAKNKGAQIHCPIAQQVPPSERLMWPHLVTEVSEQMLLMQEEIFGPILPLIGYQSPNEAVAYINAHAKPLALYILGQDKHLQQQIMTSTQSGSVAINDTLLQVSADDAPFGGVGDSGMGHYHGEEGFRTFSHARTVLRTPRWLPRAALLLRHKEKALQFLAKFFLK